jgi:hypothetical protein
MRVPVLLKWAIYKHKDATNGSCLPELKDVDKFIKFLDSVRFENKWRTMNNILQTQYQLHEAFNKSKVFNRVLKYIAKNLDVWLRGAADTASAASVDKTLDLFAGSISSLLSLFGEREALGNFGDGRLPFFVNTCCPT